MKRVPVSVYRLQLSRHFDFKQAEAILPYLKKLGVEGVYCSPLYQAHSDHGYDVTDPNRANDLLGGNKAFYHFCRALEKHQLKQIFDIVPNHMGIVGFNPWWHDVLEHGESSSYAKYFDIDWQAEKKQLQGKVLLPILHNAYAEELEKGVFALALSSKGIELHYHDTILPVDPKSYSFILKQHAKTPSALQVKSKRQFLKALESFPGAKKHVLSCLKKLNQKNQAENLNQLIEMQNYHLVHWLIAAQEINYRRFFNINELAAIRMEEPEVFDHYHRWVAELVKKGKIDGLRVDHPDGLYDPSQYFKKLRRLCPVYTVAEKILDRNEQLPEDWPIEGTVGYDYLNVLNGLFVEREHCEAITEIYQNFTEKRTPFEQLLYDNKYSFAETRMPSEINSLARRLECIVADNRLFRDFTRRDLTLAIMNLIASFPVYRSYIHPSSKKVSERDQHYIKQALHLAREKNKTLDGAIFDFLEELLMLRLEGSRKQQKEYRDFIMRFQQLTAPIMAKGMEDTCFYLYNRLISLNEVGGDPDHFGYTLDEFHAYNQLMSKKYPTSFLASSTHDTKRNEEVRMRINAISELPEEWERNLKKWRKILFPLKKMHKDQEVPGKNCEYYLYQTLLGFLPVDLKITPDIIQRMETHILKAVREARTRTSWMYVDTTYEKLLLQTLRKILKNSAFLTAFAPFHKSIEHLGVLNSLSATVVKLGSCGIIDLYQGTEIMERTLVDPDNRRPVDFTYCEELLDVILDQPFDDLIHANDFDQIKLYLYYRALHFRHENKNLMLKGEYVPLKVAGPYKNNVIAFARVHNKKAVIIACGRFFSTFSKMPTGELWKKTALIIPRKIAGQQFQDLFSENAVVISKQRGEKIIYLSDAFAKLPLCWLERCL